MAKWNSVAHKDNTLIEEAQKTQQASQATAFESQLARALRKDNAAERKASIVKYCGLYANVQEADVLKQFWDEAQKVLQS